MSFTPPTVTGFSPFWSGAYARPGNGNEADYNAVNRFARSNTERMVSQALGRGGFRAMRRVLRVLNGAAPGSNATETYSRIAADAQGPTAIGPGGARNVESVTLINANTTAAQRDYINALINDQVYDTRPAIPAGYAVDVSGNGGGGKRGF